MGKYRDHRQPRGKNFESEGESFEPRYFERRSNPQTPASASILPACDAEVVWFNAEKGFGFLRLSDGSDAFMHQSKLEASGYGSLSEGTPLKVRVEPGQKGQQVVEVVSVGVLVGSKVDAKRSGPKQMIEPSPLEEQGVGVVKRYDATKGFGFIGLDSGKDVFVHATTLARCRVPPLEVGQNVILRYSQGAKGLEAVAVELR